MNISLIAALSKNNIIGKKNQLPWKLSEDFLWFKFITLHKPIIMGRRTWESIKSPLQNRLNIVVSHKYANKKRNKGVIWTSSIEEAISICSLEKEIMIIGGGSIYHQVIQKAKRMYLTYIDISIIDGDTFFPKFSLSDWTTCYFSSYKSDIQNPYNYCFKIFEKK